LGAEALPPPKLSFIIAPEGGWRLEARRGKKGCLALFVSLNLAGGSLQAPEMESWLRPRGALNIKGKGELGGHGGV
jgi:hypothetical protein